MYKNTKDKYKLLEDTQLFVLDMDGTFYLGDNILPGALDFLEAVKQRNRDFIFFTNNSSKSPEIYIRKLMGMNCLINRDKIMTSGDVTIQYLKKYYSDKSVYLAGTPALEESFVYSGIQLTKAMPDIVVVGFDTTFTYDKLERACTYIRNGAVFLATHLDINCPTEDGFIPDCGSLCAAITLSTGVTPKYLGKPFRETVDMILESTGSKLENTAFVGDRLYTDVACGVNNGAMGFLVLTGEAGYEDIDKSDIKPDAVFDSIGEMGKLLMEEA